MQVCLNPNCQQQNISGTKFCSLCGTKFLLRDRYQVVNFIGEGAFGRTFKAVDQDKLNRRCVVKQFLPQQMGSGARAKATELFQQEAERLDHLGSHPQIPDLLAFFEQDRRLYLIQQFIDGQDLFKELNQNGKFYEQQVRELINQLLPVLDFIHSHNVIHRDIKPDNIIRVADGRTLVLIDFGVSKLVSGSILTRMGTIAGTPGYAPPEQMRGMVYPASDLYSLGVTCIRLLTGCLPHEDGSDELFDPLKMEWTWRQRVKVNDDLGQILDKLLQDKVGDRYQSAGDVAQALNSRKHTKLNPSQLPKPQIKLRSTHTQVNPSQPLKPQVKLISAVGVDYTQLQNLLAGGRWKDANLETDRVMLIAAGRDKIGRFKEHSIENFPCDDLRIINQLWLDSSNGRFGFSVQKQIWLECGGEINYETEEKLGDRLGWYANNEWISLSSIRYSLDAPPGHLPGWLREPTFAWVLPGRWVAWSCQLASRAASCGL